MALIALGREAEGLARLERVLKLRASGDSVHAAFASLMAAHLMSNQAEQAAPWIARLHEFEPADTPIERRLEARINAILNAGHHHGPEAAELLLDAALRSGPEDIRARLEFFSPAIQYAKTGDEQSLAHLPEPEREVAKRIAATMLENKGGTVQPAPLTTPQLTPGRES
jgi:hypothetical protein